MCTRHASRRLHHLAKPFVGRSGSSSESVEDGLDGSRPPLGPRLFGCLCTAANLSMRLVVGCCLPRVNRTRHIFCARCRATIVDVNARCASRRREHAPLTYSRLRRICGKRREPPLRVRLRCFLKSDVRCNRRCTASRGTRRKLTLANSKSHLLSNFLMIVSSSTPETRCAE